MTALRGDRVGPPSRHAEPLAVRLDLCIVGRTEDLQDRYRLTRRGTRRLRDSAPGCQDQKSRACSSDAKSRHCVLRCAMIRIGTGRRDATLTQMGIFRASADGKAAQLSASCRGSSRRPRSLGSSAVVFAARSRRSTHLNDAVVHPRLRSIESVLPKLSRCRPWRLVLTSGRPRRAVARRCRLGDAAHGWSFDSLASAWLSGASTRSGQCLSTYRQ